jgi:hypothetical protein
MPDLNGTGPHNRGPLTGRGYGKCILPLNTPEEELSFLENRRQALSQELHNLEARLAVLKNQPKRSTR